jgi:hypothetical protein
MRCKKVIATAILVLAHTLISVSQSRPPTLYRDKGACAGEGCSYGGRARLLEPTAAYTSSCLNSTQLTTFRRGDEVVALTGEAHIEPSRVIVNNIELSQCDLIVVKGGDILSQASMKGALLHCRTSPFAS